MSKASHGFSLFPTRVSARQLRLRYPGSIVGVKLDVEESAYSLLLNYTLFLLLVGYVGWRIYLHEFGLWTIFFGYLLTITLFNIWYLRVTYATARIRGWKKWVLHRTDARTFARDLGIPHYYDANNYTTHFFCEMDYTKARLALP
jgi:hypothetical protein